MLYEPDHAALEARLPRLREAGLASVPSSDLDWDRRGVTFEGPDGHRTVRANRRRAA